METSNHKKYLSKNPLKRKCIENFQKSLCNMVSFTKQPKNLLDVGCGEGFNLKAIREIVDCDVYGLDRNESSLQIARAHVKDGQFIKGDIYNLPYKDDEFDLVICTEVLEHLEEPQKALQELVRVSNKDLILSVPHEPFFRIGNLLALSHVSELGNAPGHINHWNPSSFTSLVKPYIPNVQIHLSFPWIIAYGSIK